MIEFKADRSTGAVQGHINGSALDTTLEVCMIIGAIHNELGKSGGPETQRLYRAILKRLVAKESVFESVEEGEHDHD